MKQKIVMRVQMKCKKCHSTALQIAACKDGVSFVGLEGDYKDKVVVVGDGVDSISLAKALRKKMGVAEIISVAAV